MSAVKFLALFSLVLASAAVATDAPRLNFPEAKIQPFPRSLLEAAKQQRQPSPFLGKVEAWPRSKTPSKPLAAPDPSAPTAPSVPSTPRQISRMPVLVPQLRANEKRAIKVPETSIEYSLLVKKPDVETVNEVKAP